MSGLSPEMTKIIAFLEQRDRRVTVANKMISFNSPGGTHFLIEEKKFGLIQVSVAGNSRYIGTKGEHINKYLQSNDWKTTSAY